MDPGGRPTKLTPELQAKILDLIRAGNYRKIASGACGVRDRTFCTWMRLGKNAKTGIHRDFFLSVLRAEKDAETIMVAKLVAGADKDPKAALAYLERKFHKRWGKKDSAPKSEEEKMRALVDIVVASVLQVKRAQADHPAIGSPESNGANRGANGVPT